MKFNKKQASRDQLAVMSWNIQDSTGDGSNKFENKEFLSILNQADILCLQETKKQVKIEGYLSFNSNRKNSRSGGVCILAENDLRKGVSCVPCSESDDIIVVKLDKNFFKLDFDLFLVCYYISPAYSSYVKKIQTILLILSPLLTPSVSDYVKRERLSCVAMQMQELENSQTISSLVMHLPCMTFTMTLDLNMTSKNPETTLT